MRAPDAAPLIVVAGGTSESRVATRALLNGGFRVLWSQATETAFELEEHESLMRRRGRLDVAGWTELLMDTAAAAVVDAAHPHASVLHRTLWEATTRLELDLFRLTRAEVQVAGEVWKASNHADAARISCVDRGSVLLTVGTRHLAPYVSEARKHGTKLTARVLDAAESRRAVAELGLRESEVVYGRGPYSVEQNLELIERTRAEVLVLKDSGKEGGMIEKIEAAKLADCRVVVITRPEERADPVTTVDEMMQRLCSRLKLRGVSTRRTRV